MSQTPSPVADTHVHPEYSSPNADAVLRSRDGVSFRVSSDVLSRASGFMQTMFSLPQPQAQDRIKPIQMDESSDILAQLLSILHNQALPPLTHSDSLEALLIAAEKYDMPTVISALRLALFSRLADVPPLRLYGIACRMGWKEEAEHASSRTLTMDLLAREAQVELASMDPRHRDMLLDLHRSRREMFFARLDDTTAFPANSPGFLCNAVVQSSCAAQLDHTRWWSLKYSLVQRWSHSPLGEELDASFYNAPEVWDVAKARCVKCNRCLYNMATTINIINAIIYRLPRCVDWS